MRTSAGRRVSLSLGVLVGGMAVASVALVVAAGWGAAQAFEWFVPSNVVIGLSFGLCGVLIAWHRPRILIGWLMAAAGVAHLLSAVAAPLTAVLAADGATTGVRLGTTVFSLAWPWSIALFLPLVLVLYPDGRLPAPGWRWVVAALVVTAPLFVATGLDRSDTPVPAAPAYGAIADFDSLAWLWTLAELRALGGLLVGVVALVLRYRRGADTERRQVLWLLLAATVVLGFILPWSLLSGTSALVLFTIPLVPVSVALAVVRHQLLDIEVVVSRVLSWALLSSGVLVVYSAAVGLADRLAADRLGRSAALTVVLVLVAAPVLPRLQRLVERRLYGERRDPAGLVSRIGPHLASGRSGGLGGTVADVALALRLPYVALVADGTVVGESGAAPRELRSVPLTYDDHPVGELRVGLRSGERELASADRAALQLVAAPLAVALHSQLLSDQLQASRERIVAAREDERRRLRRDLHDGLGPSLTGIALTADAATNLLGSDLAAARDLLERLSSRTRTAIGEVRRLVDDLRPPALDELGLLGALRQHTEEIRWRAGGAPFDVALDLPGELPSLPAAVEVAAYRIATEALTNVVRHAGAKRAWLAVSAGERLCIEVTDDGGDTGAVDGGWVPGVGLEAMRERTAELGGRFDAGPGAAGGRVRVELPLGSP